MRLQSSFPKLQLLIPLQECIDWAKEEKRIFLRQSLEARLIGLYYETERFADALTLGSQLLKELKKLDDKNLLVEVGRSRCCLLEGEGLFLMRFSNYS